MATLQAGRWIESKLAERDKQGNALWTLEALLGDEPARPQYASLRREGIRKMQVPESGIW